jgi:protein-S-isoprenylcysteine O-methyltransferase Ste14
LGAASLASALPLRELEGEGEDDAKMTKVRVLLGVVGALLLLVGPHRVAHVLGWTLVGWGMALATWFIRTMRSADTTLDVNKPVSSLVQDGPFRYSRNPGYLSLAMIYAGIAILRNALWAMLFLPLLLVTQRELIEREERYLERTFGEGYLAHKRMVRCWV